MLWPPNLVCRHPSLGRTLSRWQLPRVLHLIWQTTARSRGTRGTVSLPRSRWIIAEESFSTSPLTNLKRGWAFQFFSPFLPPPFRRFHQLFHGTRAERCVARDSLHSRFSGWNRFLRELSKETLSRTLDRGGCRFFWKETLFFFLFFNGKNFVRYRWKKKRQRKGIKKGIFLLKNRRITWWRILEKEGWVVKDGATLSGPFFAQVNGSARCWPGRGEKYINYPWGVRGTPLGENLRAN